MTSLMIGAAVCQVRVEGIVAGDFCYVAGIVHLARKEKHANVLVVQRRLRDARTCEPFEIVRQREIPSEVKRHPKIKVWLEGTGKLATFKEAGRLVKGRISSYHAPSLASGQALMMDGY